MFRIQEAKDKINTRERVDSLLKAVKENKILTLVVEPSSRCNLTCKFCDLHSGRIQNIDKYKGVMSEELLRRLVDLLADLRYRLKQLQIHGCGEPLLNKYLDKFIGYASEKRVAESIRLTTNGTMLTPALLDRLLQSGVSEIRVSLDAADRGLFSRFKGKDLYGKVYDNLRHAINQIEALKKSSLVIKYPLPTDDQPYGVTRDFMDSVFTVFGDVAKDSGFVHLLGMPVATLPLGNMHKDVEFNEPCEIPFYSLFVRFDGRVSVCCADFAEGLDIGNINHQTIGEILAGQRLRALRTKHLVRDFSAIPTCKYCGNRTCVDITPIADDLMDLIKHS